MSETIQTVVSIKDETTKAMNSIIGSWNKYQKTVQKSIDDDDKKKRSITGVEKSFLKFDQAISRHATGFIKGTKSVVNHLKAVHQLKSATKSNEIEIEKTNKLNKTYLKSYNENAKILSKTNPLMVALSNEISKNAQKVRDLTWSNKLYSKQLRDLKKVAIWNTFVKIGKASVTLGKGYLQIIKYGTRASIVMAKFVGKGVTRALSVIGQKLLGISEGFGRIGRGGIGALKQAMSDLLRGVMQKLTSALKNLAFAGVQSFASLQFSMQKIKNFMGGTAEGMVGVKEAITENAKASIFPLDELTSAYESLASVGDLTADELIILGQTMENLATASGGDLVATGELLAKTLNAFGLEADVMSDQVGNALLKVANDSALSMADIGVAMQLASANANQLGISVNDTASMLGVLSNMGYSASRAGTSLNQALTKMIKPSVGAKNIMKDLGISFFDSKGEMKDMDEILADLNKSFGEGIKTEEELAKITEIFGVRGSRAMLSLMTGADDLDTMVGNVSESMTLAGTSASLLQTQAGDMADTIQAKMQSARNSVELLKASFGEALAPAIGEALTVFTDFINENEAFQTFMADLGAVLNEVMLNLLPIIEDILPFFIEMLTALMPIIEVVAGVLGDFFKIFTENEDLMKTIINIIGMVVEIMEALLVPFMELIEVLMVELFPVLEELMVIFIDNLLPIIVEFIDLFIELMPVIMPIVKKFLKIISKLAPVVAELLRVFMKLFFALLEALMPILDVLMDMILDNMDMFVLLISVVTMVLEVFMFFIPVIKVVVKVFAFFMKIMSRNMKALMWIITIILEGLKSLISQIVKIGKAVGLGKLVSPLEGAADSLGRTIDAMNNSTMDFGESPEFEGGGVNTYGADIGSTDPSTVNNANTVNTTNFEEGGIVLNFGAEVTDPEEIAEAVTTAVAEALAKGII